MTDSKPAIGYIGLGLMGQPMVMRLLSAGYRVTVWNRTAEKLSGVLEKGAVAAKTPAALAAESDYVFLCLTNADAAEAVVFGPDGVAGSRRPKALVDFSTIHPDRARELAHRLDESSDIGWIDAPVSGGVPGAEAGTLAIMAGGSEADIEAVRPVIENLSARFTRMGDVGAGLLTKLCNQIISGCTMAIVAEAVNFAEKSGVDAHRLTAALKGGFADSTPFQLFAPRMAGRDFEDPLGTTDTMLKDLVAVADVAAGNSAVVPMTDRALSILRDTSDHGDGDSDISTIIRFFERGGDPS
jgi:3-hydroxyisobutyrate dehydrogenase